MKLPKILTPKAAYVNAGICALAAIGLMLLGPMTQAILWVAAVVLLAYGAAMQFAPEELEAVKKAAKEAKATATKNPAGGP